jgi:ubiquinone/menaquinone biosynthesis C-methylase UbiE
MLLSLMSAQVPELIYACRRNLVIAVVGLDLSDEAIRFCAEKGLGVVHRGDVCDLPFEDASLDLVLATDIIENVEDDRLALSEIARVLVPDGRR